MDGRNRIPLVASLVFLAAAAYFGSFADYGFLFEDEGTLLTQFWRWSTGATPYNEFHIGYTPGVYVVHGTLMEWLGPGLMPGRHLLSVVNAATATVLFVLAARLTSSWKWGLLAPLLFLATLPVYPGRFCSFNIPYPSWYAVLLFALTAAVSGTGPGGPRLSVSFAWGLLAGLGFAFKPNVGLFQLAASALVCLLAFGRPRARLEAALWWTWWTAVLGGLVAVFWTATTVLERATFLAPVFVAALAVARDAYASPPREGGPSLFACASAMAAGFFLVSIPWFWWAWSLLGPDWFLRRGFFFGTGFESFYYLAHPPLAVPLVVAFAAAAAWSVPRWLDRRGWPAFLLPIALGAAAVAVFAYLAATRPMPDGLYASVMKVAEQKVYAATMLLQWALLILWLARGARTRAEAALLAPLCICGFLLYLQIFPRTDFMHWAVAVPLLLPAVPWLLQRLTIRWSSGTGSFARRSVALALALPVLALASSRIVHFLDARWDWNGGAIVRSPETTLRVAHAPVSINAGRAEQFRDLEDTIDYVRKQSAPTDTVFTFPALDYVSYLSLRSPGNRHGYYYPGWPGHETEAEVLTSLERAPPRLAITRYEPQVYFGTAPAYYFLFAGFFENRFERVASLGPYAILAQREARTAAPEREESAARPAAREAVSDALGADRVGRLRTELASPDAAVRRHAVERMEEWHLAGDFEPLTAALTDADPSVRSAAVRAVAEAQSPLVREALLRGVVEGRFTTQDSIRALRACAMTCDVGCVSPLLEILESKDRGTAAAARVLLAELAILRWVSDFWWKWEGDRAGPLDAAAVTKLRRALSQPDSDREVRMLAFAFADRLDLRRCPAPLRRWAAKSSDETGPDFTVCLALHHLSRAGCPGPWLEHALSWLPLDGTLTPRTVLREAMREPRAADVALARHVETETGSASAIALWICGVAGSERCLAAARAMLAGPAEEQQRVAAAWAWSQLAPDQASLEELGTVASNDASPQVRETARYGITLRMHRAEARTK